MQVATRQVCPGACPSEEVGDCDAHSAALSMRQAGWQVEVHNGEVEAITQGYDQPEQVHITLALYRPALGGHAAWVDEDGKATAVVGRSMPGAVVQVVEDAGCSSRAHFLQAGDVGVAVVEEGQQEG